MSKIWSAELIKELEEANNTETSTERLEVLACSKKDLMVAVLVLRNPNVSDFARCKAAKVHGEAIICLGKEAWKWMLTAPQNVLPLPDGFC